MLLLLLLLLSPLLASAFPIILNHKDVWQPKRSRCINNAPAYNRCGVRSSGCNEDTGNCILSPFIGYGVNNTNFMNIGFFRFPELWPGKSDGMLKTELTFLLPSALNFQGYVQLWAYSETVNSLDLYEYTRKSYYIYDPNALDSDGLPWHVYFNNLVSGTYVAVYWDTGGTRYGLGLPEMSGPLSFPSIFPVPIRTLRYEMIPQQSNNYTDYTYQDTLYGAPSRQFISYRLTAEPELPDYVLEQYIVRANSSHRPLVHEWRTKEGNILNAKTWAEFASKGDGDSMLKFKIYPLSSGGYAYNHGNSFYMGLPQFKTGFATVISATFRYNNHHPYTYQEFWNYRDRYGRATLIANKTLYSVAHEVVCTFNIPTFAGECDQLERLTFAQNYVEHVDPHYDILHVYFMDNQQWCRNSFYGDSCISAQQNGLRDMTGELFTMQDWYQQEEFATSGTAGRENPPRYETLGFRYEMSYVDHDNTWADANDCNCKHIGTNYAKNIDAQTAYVGNTPFGYDIPSKTSWQYHPLADVQFGTRRARKFFGPDECGDGSVCSHYTCTDTGNCNDNNLVSSYNVLDSFCSCVNMLFQYEHKNSDAIRGNTNNQHNVASYDSACNGMCVNYNNNIEVFIGSSITMTPWTYANLVQVSGALYADMNLFQQPLCYGFGVAPADIGLIVLACAGNPFACAVSSTFHFPFCIKDEAAGPRPSTYLWQPATVYGSLHAGLNSYPAYQNERQFTGGSARSDFINNGLPHGVFIVNPTKCIVNNYIPNTCPLWALGDLTIPQHPLVFDTLTDLSNAPRGDSQYYGYDDYAPGDASPSSRGRVLDIYNVYDVYQGSPFFSHRRGTFGPDVGLATVQTVVKLNERFTGAFDMWLTHTSAVYPHYKVVPEITWERFANAQKANNGLPDAIEIQFYVDCPLVETHFNDAEVGYCAETWTVMNQHNKSLVLQVLQGGLDFLGAPYGFGANKTLAPVIQHAFFAVLIEYNDKDVLSFIFRPRTVFEKPIIEAYCEQVALYTIEVPPKGQEIMDLIVLARTNTPACEWMKPEILSQVIGGQRYVYESLLRDPASNDALNGQPYLRSDQQFTYDIWETNSAGTVRGFTQEAVTYDPPMSGQFCDMLRCIDIANGDIVLSPVPATFPNPLLRPPRCTLTVATGTCSVNLDDNPAYSGVDTYPTCEVIAGVPTNYILSSPRLRFNFPYSYLANVGTVIGKVCPLNVDIFIEEQQTSTIFQQQQYLVVYNTAMLCWEVRYGLTIDSFFEAACLEILTVKAIVLSSFVAQPQPLIRIPGCVRADNCCYQVPVRVFGNNPFTEGTVDMDDNATNSCFGTPECTYEVVISPPANGDGGLCMGVTYTFTIQNPAALVTNRALPSYFNTTTSVPAVPYPKAWRCPATFTLTIPFAGISPIDVVETPGGCIDPGTKVEYTFTVNDPLCTGPVSVLNSNPNCRKNLYFAIESQNAIPFPGAPVRADLFLIAGPFTFTYNIEGTYVFTQTVPNGYWAVYFWLALASAPGPQQSYLAVSTATPENTATTVILASLAADSGLLIERNLLIRPPCAGPPIQIGFVFYDETFECPCLFEFRSPSGRLISSATVTAFDYLNPGIITDPVAYQNALNEKIRSEGIPYTAYVPTGNISTAESGGYFLTVTVVTTCALQYFEFMNELRTLEVQIECRNATCYGGTDANVITSITGGTSFPRLNLTLIQGAFGVPYRPLYSTVWTPTPLGPLFTPLLLRVPTGFYSVRVTDFTGICTATASCTAGSKTGAVTLVPDGVIPPNCTAKVGTIKFRVVGANPSDVWTLYKKNPVPQSLSTGLLTDQSARPGVNTTYMACNDKGCCTPEVSFVLSGGIIFELAIVTNLYPCALNSPTGRMTANIPTKNIGTQFSWYLLSTNQLIGIGAVLDQVPAGTYLVVANSSLYDCFTSTIYTLQTRTPPSITLTRNFDTTLQNNNGYDLVVGAVFSVNGPPYTITFDGIHVNSGPGSPVFDVTHLGTQDTFRIHMVRIEAIFTIIVQDNGNCISTKTSFGHLNPGVLTQNSQTPLRNITRAENRIKKERSIITVVLFIGLGGISLFVVLMLLVLLTRRNDYPPRETKTHAKK